MPHLQREDFSARHPVHVTMRLLPGVGYLRGASRAHIVLDSLRAATGVRVIHYSVQGNHLHLIVEAANAAILSRAMCSLATRLAKRLNVAARRRGPVFVDRYHSRALRTPREVRNAIHYVATNYHHNAREQPPDTQRDPLATTAAAPMNPPTIWLLAVGWRRAPP